MVFVALAAVMGHFDLWPTAPRHRNNGGTIMSESPTRLEASETPPGLARATFGGGCFWCTEAVIQRLKGVHAVVSGYSGGSVKNPTYEQICTGTTGHAEAIQVTFDPAVISY